VGEVYLMGPMLSFAAAECKSKRAVDRIALVMKKEEEEKRRTIRGDIKLGIRFLGRARSIRFRSYYSFNR